MGIHVVQFSFTHSYCIYYEQLGSSSSILVYFSSSGSRKLISLVCMGGYGNNFIKNSKIQIN